MYAFKRALKIFRLLYIGYETIAPDAYAKYFDKHAKAMIEIYSFVILDIIQMVNHLEEELKKEKIEINACVIRDDGLRNATNARLFIRSDIKYFRAKY